GARPRRDHRRTPTVAAGLLAWRASAARCVPAATAAGRAPGWRRPRAAPTPRPPPPRAGTRKDAGRPSRTAGQAGRTGPGSRPLRRQRLVAFAVRRILFPGRFPFPVARRARPVLALAPEDAPHRPGDDEQERRAEGHEQGPQRAEQ